MRLSHRSRTADGLPWGVWVFPALALVAAGAWLVSQGMVHLGTCGLKQMLGIPCLSCGATRATLFLLEGDVGAAFAMQPLVVVGYGLMTAWGIVALGSALTGRTLEVSLTQRESTLLKFTVVILPLANWCYLIIAGI